MFQFPPFAPASLVTVLQTAGLPHSEISGSKPVCSSPELVAAYHVLRRLQKPRHPPSALVTFSLYVLLYMNHKNFSFTLVLIYSLPWNCSPQLFDLTLYHFSSYRLINFYLLTLPRYLFSNLSMNCPLFLKRAAKIRTFFYPPNFSEFFLRFFWLFSSPFSQLPDNQVWLNISIFITIFVVRKTNYNTII